jgi:NADH-quinone oxidoreductase subunit A
MLTLFETYYPILFLLLFAGFLSAVFLGFSIFLGRRTKLGKKSSPYECGVDPVGSTKEPIQVKFFLVAILFILFDIEVIFLYPWAVIYRKLGVFGFMEMLVFVIILLVGYFYVLGRGALKWE